MLVNKETGVKTQILHYNGMYYAECSDGDHTHGHKSREELVQLLKSWGFEDI